MNELMTTEEALARAIALDCFTFVGLDLHNHHTREDYYAIAVQIKMMGDAAGYARADLAYRIKTIYPDDYKERWEELATLLGKMSSTLANDALVGQKYSHEERLYWMERGVSYSAMRICAPVEPRDAREDLLRECATGLTITGLCQKLYGPSKRLPPPSRDAPPIRERVGGWLDTLNEADRGYAEYYVKLFVDWLESSQTTPNP
jgi:hypothetical protein